MKCSRYTAAAALVFLAVLARGEEAFSLPERTENAALHYWKAVALLAEPVAAEEIEALQFIEGDLQDLPPRALQDRPVVQALLDRDAEAMRALHEGASKPRCNFDLDYEKGPALELPHLAVRRGPVRPHRGESVRRLVPAGPSRAPAETEG